MDGARSLCVLKISSMSTTVVEIYTELLQHCECIYVYMYIGSLGKFLPIFKEFGRQKGHIGKFFAEIPGRFWKHGIFKLHERWSMVVEQNATYIIR